MKVKIKSREQLYKEGWKRNNEGMHLGDAVSRSEHRINLQIVFHVLGSEVDILDFSSNTSGAGPRFLITDKNGFDCWVPWYILEGEHPKRKAFKDYIVEKRIGNNRGLNVFNKKFKTFNFDCSYSKLDRASARKLASWILEVSK